jgi:hypothetical protein
MLSQSQAQALKCVLNGNDDELISKDIAIKINKKLNEYKNRFALCMFDFGTINSNDISKSQSQRNIREAFNIALGYELMTISQGFYFVCHYGQVPVKGENGILVFADACNARKFMELNRHTNKMYVLYLNENLANYDWLEMQPIEKIEQ